MAADDTLIDFEISNCKLSLGALKKDKDACKETEAIKKEALGILESMEDGKLVDQLKSLSSRPYCSVEKKNTLLQKRTRSGMRRMNYNLSSWKTNRLM